MPLVVTPRQLAQRAELYQQLNQLLSAGVPVVQALEMVRRSPPSRSFRQPLTEALYYISRGSTFNEAIRAAGEWTPSFDIALLGAGETSGRLPQTLKTLSDYYQDRAQLARQTLGAMIYPAFLFHFAILIFPLPQLFLTGDWIAYGKQTLGVLLPIYAIVAVILFAIQSRHGEWWRGLMEQLARIIPVLGRGRRAMALARLSIALEALINAGVPILEAWPQAATASGSPALRKTVTSWRSQLDAGIPPSELLEEKFPFQELFCNLYRTGEVSGQLDDSLKRLHAHYDDEARRKYRAFSEWVPKLVYFAVMIMIAWRVISFWRGYFDQIGQALNF